MAVAGAGAMGCRFGWRLYQTGLDVLLIDDWKEHVQAIQAGGLKVITENGSEVAKIPASLPGASSGIVDLLILFTKAMQTDNMLRKTEIEHLNGAIVNKAKRYGIDVPSNALIYDLIRMMEHIGAHGAQPHEHYGK